MDEAHGMKIKALIVDDETLGRKRLRKLLESHADCELAGEARNGVEAIALLKHLRPDLMFLDVQMPELDGFEMLAQTPLDELPVTIFVTAFDQHALRAFNANALDYLVKPFDDERFDLALDRARIYLNGARTRNFHHQIESLLQGVRPTSGLSRIAIKAGDKITFLNLADIDWVEALGNYLKIHAGNESHVLRGRMTELEAQLDPRQFFRIHRSTLVNLARVKELAVLCKGEGVALLHAGQRLNVSRQSLQELQRMLQPKL
jgi:two-component system LytT family response regulator